MNHHADKRDFGSTGLSGRNLKDALKKAKISKYRLAKDLNISYRIVQYWAKGRKPSHAMADKVATYLKRNTDAEILVDHEHRLARIEEKLGMKEERFASKI